MERKGNFPRFQEVVLPILRAGLPEDVKVGSWIEDIDYREYPMVNVRRVGGPRSKSRPHDLDNPTVELTAYHGDGLIEAEELYTQCLDLLFEAQEKQTTTEAGHLSRVEEFMGMTQFSSLFQDSWRVQGLISMTIRPNRKD
ncbi:hypothetical protein LA324_05425 [Corynebacterium coyleae]|uniref:hypothetical protein n=1 Tax=Corynebacterium coyleae TaxID=53374 RepID=UPI001CC8EE8D|nr:hypothetical protein [Corynebacterium coyleae]UBI10050.1 hypothetical protein LA324_05425 [Corynebacterium coyleae]